VQRVAVANAIAAHRSRAGGLVPLLHAIQDALGFVPPQAVPAIAEALNLSRAEVHGVISFYHHFRTTPAGRRTLRLCRAEACQAMGAERLAQAVRAQLGIDWHGTTSDGALTLEPVYCLGNCSLSPAVLVGEDIRGRMTPDKFDALIGELREPA
jgi:formate dehydrogenase subunit gamma